VGPSTGFDVLVRGVVDGILPAADAIEVLDFKTDAIKSEEAEGQSTRYRPQMELYARAMGRMWRRPVRACHLVFLRARKVVTMDMSKFRA
jgi:ATP-dependent helicase/nuclease subunit A